MSTTSSQDTFAERILRMERIQRGEEVYGDGSPALQATAFYIEHMLAEAAERALSRSRLPEQRVDLLISICGFAATPTLLTYELLRPSRVLVLRSQNATESVNLIGNYLVRPDRLAFEDFQHQTVDSSDPLDIYGRIASWLTGRAHQNAVIDITGGRKVMSAAAALAAWQLDLGLTYVENQFDPDTRQALPGEDRLITLDNPTSLFGEQEMQRALETFRSGAFDAARYRYAEISGRIASPGRARLMRSLSQLYRDWCNLDLTSLSASAGEVEDNLRLARRGVTEKSAQTIRQQLNFAKRLARGGDPTAFVVWFYVLGKHYQRLGRYDFAAMLFYRTIEGCFTSRLQRKFSGFDPENPDYSLIGSLTLQTKYANAAKSLTPPAGAKPPPKLSLFASALLTAAIDDDLARHALYTDPTGHPDPVRLSELRNRTLARNKSVLAHGMAAISAADTEALRIEAKTVLDGYWQLHGDTVKLDDLCRDLAFLQTDE